MMKRTIVIGTRGSKLALWQAYHTKKMLEQAGYSITIQIIKTRGDKIQHLGFDKMEGKGFFTKEIETALIDGDIDLAVHSYKDLPTDYPPGLVIAANSQRANPQDWLIINQNAVDTTQPLHLKTGAIVGTSSARRKSQLIALQDNIELKDIRGNVPTRIRKLAEGWDAVVLAAAGLTRLELNLKDYHVFPLAPTHMVAAPAQGVLAFQIRENDTFLQDAVRVLHDEQTANKVNIERSILKGLGGGCQQPIGVHCQQVAGQFLVWTVFAKEWTDFPKRVFLRGFSPDKLVNTAIESLKFIDEKSVFISRKLNDNSFFKKAIKARGYSLHHQPLLQIAPLAFGKFPATDWVFFTSQNGVRHFFGQQPELNGTTRFAAIGKATAAVLQAFGKEAAFTGQGGDTAKIAHQFGEMTRQQTILIPQAATPIKTVNEILSIYATVYPISVYTNTPSDDFELPPCDILVFTSPMNARAYYGKYPVNATQKVIAIGNATARQLEKLEVTNVVLSYAPDEVSLSDVCW